MSDMNEVFHLFGHTLVLRNSFNIKFKTGVKTKARLLKKFAEMFSVPGDYFKLISHSSLNISIFSMLIKQIGYRPQVFMRYSM